MKSLLATVSLATLLAFPVMVQAADKMSDDKSISDSATTMKPAKSSQGSGRVAARDTARSPATADPEHGRIVELNLQQLRQIEQQQGSSGSLTR